MERWQNKIAVVTGASSGIGAAVALDLIKSGVIVVGLARRVHRMDMLRMRLPGELQGRLYPIKCDVRNEQEVKNAFSWIEKNLGGVDILINCAGVFRYTKLIDLENTKDVKETLDTQIMGIVFCTREAYQSMQSRDVPGQIVNINSTIGHHVPVLSDTFHSFNICAASKYAVTAMSETYRQEFAGSKIKISSISPGITRTELLLNEVLSIDIPMLEPTDVSNAILFIIGTPPHVEVQDLKIKPIGEIL